MIARNLVVHVEVLSDVHIGTGTELVRDFDWVAPGDGWIYIADNDKLLETVFQRAEESGSNMVEVANTLAASTLADLQKMGWLTRADFGPSHDLFRYRLRGSPATINIREQIKNVFGQPYLPGSSLKGALRTILAVGGAQRLKVSFDNLGGSRSRAAQPVERRLFGSDPNHDMLRGLQVADSEPVDPAQLRLRRAHIYPSATTSYRGRSKGLDVDLETLARGTEFDLSIHVTTELFEERNKPMDERRREELPHWEKRAGWLDRMTEFAFHNARTLLEDEILYFQERTDVPAVHQFYNELANQFAALKRNQMLLVLGWGGGWQTKTFNRLLKADPKAFERLIARYRLNPTGNTKPGDPFPKSRHLLRIGDKPGPPMGWVKVTLD